MAAEPSNNSKIVIDLGYTPGREMKHELQIHREAHEHVIKMIERQIGQKTEDRGRFACRHMHQCILINGTRGSGKTTFLLNLLNQIQGGTDGGGSPVLGKASVLRLVDPTLLESKENILVTVISEIKELVDTRFRKGGFDDDQTKRQRYRNWQDTLVKLTKGLTLLDTIGPASASQEGWGDPSYTVDTQLDNARTSMGFEKSFHGFIAKSLEVLGSSAFVLAFDDIDTDFTRGWAVLETIRKYLTPPQLIVILAGDLNLFSRLVRRAHYEGLGDSLLKYDRPSSEFHRDEDRFPWRNDRLAAFVNRLEEQYLLKLLTPQYRISLGAMERDFLMERKVDVMVRSSKYRNGAPPDWPLTEFLETMIKEAFGITGRFQVLHHSAILRQPLRTTIQILQAAEPFVFCTDAQGNTEKKEESRRKLARTLVEIFASTLLHQREVPNSLAERDGLYVLWHLADWLTREDIWRHGASVLPDHMEDERNRMALVFAAETALHLRNSPGLGLSFILRIGMTRELLLSLEALHGVVKPRAEDRTPTLYDAVTYLGLGTREPAYVVASRWVAAQRLICERAPQVKDGQDKPSCGLALGIIPVKYEDLRELIDNNAAGPLIHIVATTVLGRGEQQNCFLSVTGLIGVMAELMGWAERKDWEFDEHEIRGLLTYERNVAAPGWFLNEIGPLRSSTEPARPMTRPNNDPIKAFIEGPIKEWMTHVHKVRWPNGQKPTAITHPAWVFTSIAHRLYAAFEHMDVENVEETKACTLLHKQICAFLDAVLTLEYSVYEAGNGGQPGNENGAFAFGPGLNKMIGFAEKRTSAFSLFSTVFSCPLLSVFLSAGGEDKWILTKHQEMSWWSPPPGLTEQRKDELKNALKKVCLSTS